MKADLLIAKATSLPAPSPAVARLIGLLQHHDTDISDVIRIVKQDPILCARLLSLCNSAAKRASIEIASVDQAIMRLGQREAHRLVMTMGFGETLSTGLSGYLIESVGLWRHSLVTAQATAFILRLAPQLDADPSIAYTAGLLHDIGKVVLNQVLTQESRSRIQTLVEGNTHSLVEAELEVVGADHAQVGARLLMLWKIPDLIVDAVAHHHQPPESSPKSLAAIVHVADVLAHEGGASPGFGSYAVRASEGSVEALGLGPAHIEELVLDTIEASSEIDVLVTSA